MMQRYSSKEDSLLLAASCGDLEKIKDLIQTGVDINHKAIFQFPKENCHRKQQNALTIAIYTGYYAVAEYLIDAGIELESKIKIPHASSYFSSWTIYSSGIMREYSDKFEFEYQKCIDNFSSALDMVLCDKDLSPDCNLSNPQVYQLIKKLIRKTKIKISELRRDYCVSLQTDEIRKALKHPTNDAILSLVFHQAILTNDSRCIALILRENKILNQIDLESFLEKEFLNQTEMLCTNQSLAYINTCQKNDDSKTTLEFMQRLEASLKVYEAFLKLPDDLQITLQKEPTNSLEELCAEFQYWLRPDLKLTQNICTQAYYDYFINCKSAKSDLSQVVSYDDIQKIQNPLSLHEFINTDINKALYYLCARLDEKDNSPAAFLLWQIVRYKANAKIQENGTDKVFLDEKLLKRAKEILINFYNLSDSTKRLNQKLFRKKLQIKKLVYKNKRRKEECKILNENFSQLKENVESLRQQFSFYSSGKNPIQMDLRHENKKLSPTILTMSKL